MPERAQPSQAHREHDQDKQGRDRDLAAAKPLLRIGIATGMVIIAAAGLWTLVILDACDVIRPNIAGSDALVGAASALTIVTAILILGYSWKAQATRDNLADHRAISETTLADLTTRQQTILDQLAQLRALNETILAAVHDAARGRAEQGEQIIAAMQRIADVAVEQAAEATVASLNERIAAGPPNAPVTPLRQPSGHTMRPTS